MTLRPGERLGPYEILEPIGAGGMGDVFRARDTRLDRIVAIKTSKTEFSERFEREARAVAALNHSGICTLHDVGPNYLVMEYIEGTPLEGPLPVGKALNYAIQICDALDAAHRKGITHRDLKPANILATRSGIKLLDFGLAKLSAAGIGQAATPIDDATFSMALTGKNEIVGTLHYMSPEQLQAPANGQGIDARSDIFSFGVVLYELLTGKRAFDGSSPASVIAAIMERPAPSIAEVAPPALDRVLRICLAKDPDDRWQSVRDLKRELEWIAAAAPTAEAPPPARAKAGALAGVMAALAMVSIASLAFVLWTRPADAPKTSARLTIALPPGHEITTYPAITRDGRTVAYVTQQGNDDPQLYLRDLNAFEARLVPGSSGARQPFFSPDGKWVAFFAQGHLQKAEVAGGAPVRLAEAGYSQGGTWSEDDTIVYASSLGSGLLRVPAGGGNVESLTTPDGAANGYAHGFPQALPGGRDLLFTMWGQTQGTALFSLESRQTNVVLPSTSFAFGIFDAMGGSGGRLLVVDPSAGMRAAPFDPARPGPTIAGATVLSNVFWEVETEVRGWMATSDTGTAVYVAGNPAKSSLVWVDREGRIDTLPAGQDLYREAALSPDGTKAVVRQGVTLWIHDLLRGTRTPLTTGSASNMLPLWSPDGSRVLFGSNRGGGWDIYSQVADGSQPAEVVLQRPYDQFTYDMLPDGTVLYLEITPATSRDIWTLSPDGKTTPLRVTPFNEGEARFSPGMSSDSGGGWVAYTSDESGRREVYVQSYPGGAKRVAISTEGGSQPRWSPDGKQLYYVTGEAIVAVDFRPDGSFGTPRRLFGRSQFLLSDYRFQTYQSSPDGMRFLMIRRDEGSVPDRLHVMLNWSGDDDRAAPSGRN
jgi:eukaryotic-like serine/threonine-protein kinase